MARRSRIATSVVALFVTVAFAVSPPTASAAKTTSKEHAFKVCRYLAVAYSPRSDFDVTFLIKDATKESRRAPSEYRKTAAEGPSVPGGTEAWAARVGALCKAAYPTDSIIRKARFPTVPVATVPPTTPPTTTPPPPPTQAPAPPPAQNVVTAGSFCSSVGATGVTSAGTPMLCSTTAKDGTPYTQPRWRSP